MTSLSSAEKNNSADSEKEDLVVYIEALAEENDYWLSITDASRVCRVQDVSIRRAIGRGVLPVRRQRAGQNKRTRFVRASDLPKAGFPIIDESATITTEIGKADILSIPQQQQRIMQDHQDLLGTFATMQDTFANFQTQVQEHFQQQQLQFQTGQRELREEQARQLESTALKLSQAQEQLQHTLAGIKAQYTQEQQIVQQTLERIQTDARQQNEHNLELLRKQQTTFEAYREEIRQALASLTSTQQAAFQAHQQTVSVALQETRQDTLERLNLLEQHLTRNQEAARQMFNEQLTALTTRCTALQQSYDSLQQSISSQDQKIKAALNEQQMQLDQQAQLLPLLPYVGQQLMTEQAAAKWTQEFADLETRLLAAQNDERARYQPLLVLFNSQRLEQLEQLLKNQEVRAAEKKSQP